MGGKEVGGRRDEQSLSSFIECIYNNQRLQSGFSTVVNVLLTLEVPKSTQKLTHTQNTSTGDIK